jgi:hypothetical protein
VNKKPLVKSTSAKKPVSAKAKKSSKPRQKKPVITDAMFEAYFFKLDPKHYVDLQKRWNEKNLKIKLTKQPDYDHWLNYFKTLSPNIIKVLAATGLDILPTEAYAALSMWHDIISHPHRINKIHQSGLTAQRDGKKQKTVLELALKNDRLGVLQATRDKIAEKLDKGAGNRDTALLTREMTEIMTQIADYEKRLGPKKTTVLGALLSEMPDSKRKRPPKNGTGARNTSFKTRVTIEDLEE